MAGRRIRGRYCRHYNQRVAFCNALGRIDSFATSQTYGAVTIVVCGNSFKPFGFLPGAFTDEIAFHKTNAEFLCRSIQLLLHPSHIIPVGNQQGRFSESPYEIAQVEQFIFALHVFCRADKRFPHNPCSFRFIKGCDTR
jgi:hypothetical protein